MKREAATGAMVVHSAAQWQLRLVATKKKKKKKKKKQMSNVAQKGCQTAVRASLTLIQPA
jgi:hypothetical protein